MKRWKTFANLAVLMLIASVLGCAGETADSDNVGVPDDPSSLSDDGGTETEAALGEAEPMDTAPSGGIALTPENTTIGFVGTHVVEEKPDPDARKGQFGKFKGSAAVENDKLESITVEIDMKSVDTGNEKLNGHLKNSDFFSVNEYPTGSFKTTKIEEADGKTMITGDLTLLDTTKSITFPATVSTEDGLNLEADFEIDRTEFGIDYDPSKVEKMVAMSIKIDA